MLLSYLLRVKFKPFARYILHLLQALIPWVYSVNYCVGMGTERLSDVSNLSTVVIGELDLKSVFVGSETSGYSRIPLSHRLVCVFCFSSR